MLIEVQRYGKCCKFATFCWNVVRLKCCKVNFDVRLYFAGKICDFSTLQHSNFSTKK
jgi:hypothetical protein